MTDFTRDDLPEGFKPMGEGQGLCASFYDDGQLKSYGYFNADGTPSRAWILHLGQGDGTAWVETRSEYTFPENATTSFDPNDDDDRDEAWDRWLHNWVESIIERAYYHLRCYFCYKSSEEVAKLIKGPGLNICSECVELCADILASEDASKEDEEE